MSSGDSTVLDRRIVAYGLPAALILVYGRYLIGFTPSGDDLVYQYLPYQHLVRQAIGLGEWPYWNPMTFCGRPLSADIQVGVLYPPNWIHWLLPLPLSFSLLFIAHSAWGLLGCFRLGRAIGLGSPASALAAALFIFSGFLTVKLATGVILFHATVAWAPWGALGALALIRRPSVRTTVGLALALAMSILAGSPQMTFYSWILIVGFALVVGLGRRPDGARPRLVRSSLCAAAALILALGLTAAQTFQTFQMTSVSFDRGAGAGWDYITEGGSLHPRLLLMLLNPGIFGPGHDEALYWGPEMGFTEACVYMTVFAWLVLIPIGCISFWKSSRNDSPAAPHALHRRLFFASVGLALLAIVLAAGRYSPLFRLFFHLIPGFDQFRVPGRLMLGFTAGVAMASGLAYDQWLRADEGGSARSGSRRWAPLGAGLGAASLILIYLGRRWFWNAFDAPVAGLYDAQLAATIGDQLGRDLLFTTARGVAFLALAASILHLLGSRRPAGSQDPEAKSETSRWRRSAPWALPALAVIELAMVAWPNQTSVRANEFYSTYYPQSEVIERLKANSKGGRVLYLDQVLSWQFDQNQPEVSRNALLMQGLADARGYDPVNARWIGVWMNLLAGLDHDLNPKGQMHVPAIALPPFLTLMGVESVLSYTDLSAIPGIEFRGLIRFPEGPLGIWSNANFSGLAFPAPDGPIENDRSRAQRLAASGAAARPDQVFSAVVYDDNISAPRLALSVEVNERFVVRALEEGPNRYRYETDFPAPAALGFAMSAYPGWKALVNGRPAAISVLSGTFMAVAVDEGAGSVEFYYEPPEGYALARRGAWLALGLTLALLGYDIWNRSRRRQGAFSAPTIQSEGPVSPSQGD